MSCLDGLDIHTHAAVVSAFCNTQYLQQFSVNHYTYNVVNTLQHDICKYQRSGNTLVALCYRVLPQALAVCVTWSDADFTLISLSWQTLYMLSVMLYAFLFYSQEIRYFLEEYNNIEALETSLEDSPGDIALWTKLARLKLHQNSDDSHAENNIRQALSTLARGLEENAQSEVC